MKSTTLCSCSLSHHSGTLGAALQISSFCSVACDKTTKRRVRYGGRHIRQFFDLQLTAVSPAWLSSQRRTSCLTQILGPMRARPVRPRARAATSEWPCECVGVWQDQTPDTELSKSPAGSQPSARPWNALSSTFSGKYVHSVTHKRAYSLLHRYTTLSPVGTLHIFYTWKNLGCAHTRTDAQTSSRTHLCFRSILFVSHYITAIVCPPSHRFDREEVHARTQLMGDSTRFFCHVLQ